MFSRRIFFLRFQFFLFYLYEFVVSPIFFHIFISQCTAWIFRWILWMQWIVENRNPSEDQRRTKEMCNCVVEAHNKMLMVTIKSLECNYDENQTMIQCTSIGTYAINSFANLWQSSSKKSTREPINYWHETMTHVHVHCNMDSLKLTRRKWSTFITIRFFQGNISNCISYFVCNFVVCQWISKLTKFVHEYFFSVSFFETKNNSSDENKSSYKFYSHNSR